MLPELLLVSAVANAGDLAPNLELRAALSGVRTGLQADLRGGARLGLWGEPDSLLFGDTYFKAQAQLMATPAYLRAGPRLVFQPIAVLELSAFALYDVYFGNFQTIIGFDDPAANYGTNDDMEALQANQAPGSGFHFGASSTLKAKAGPILVVANGEWSHWKLAADVQGDWLFEREYELLMGFSDNLLACNGLLLYEIDRDPDDGRLLRLGNITTWRMAMGSTEDMLLRSGLLASLGMGAWTHSLLVQAYLADRAYSEPFPPFFAYSMKWAPLLGEE